MKGILKFFFFVFVGLFYTQIQAQITLNQSPKSKSFIPQNKTTRSASIHLKGTIDQIGYTTLSIKILRDGAQIANYVQSLNYSNQIAPFSQAIELKTGKYFYSIKYELSGAQSYSYTVDDILVGDVFIVQGQSNALAVTSSVIFDPYNPKYNSDYIRSYGTSNRTPFTVESDTFWNNAEAVRGYSSGSIGHWAYVLARNLLDSFNTPICMLNGAVGGTSINQHQPNLNNREDLNTIYGRLLYRVRKANLDSSISGILYFQGESDGWNPVGHDIGFTNLHQYWKQDFPGFSNLYVVQVRDGCGGPTLAMREVQRQFGKKLENCTVISANGLNNHDGCHYGFVDGYEKLGYQLSKLVARDYYWPKEQTNIDPPNINYCYYSNGLQTEVTLVMENLSDLIFTDPNFESLFSVEGDATVQIVNGKIENNKIVLALNKSSCNITGLSYNGVRGAQPWVTNKVGMGLLTCYNVKIKNNDINTQYFACKDQRTTIGTTPLKNVSYSIEQLSNGTKANQSFMKISLQKNDSFKLISTYNNLPCAKKDSIILYALVEDITIPSLDEIYNICSTDTLALSPDSNKFQSFSWTQNGKEENSFKFTTNEEGNIVLNALSNMGCNYQSSSKVVKRNTFIPIESQYTICASDTLRINLRDTFLSYQWNGLPAGSSYKTSTIGSNRIEVIDSFGCPVEKEFTVAHLDKPKFYLLDTICAGETYKFDRPKAIQNWQNTNGAMGTFILVDEALISRIFITDTSGCDYTDTLRISEYPKYSFPQTIDTSICPNSSFDFVLPLGMSNYNLDGQILNQNNIQINHPDKYQFSFKDSYQCSFIGDLNIKLSDIPNLNFITDTTLCFFDSLNIELDSALQFEINSLAVSGNYIFKPNNEYNIFATNKNSCENAKTISIGSKVCINSIKEFKSFKLYPNPFTHKIFLEKLDRNVSSIKVYTQSGKLIWSKTNHIGSSEMIDLSQFSGSLYILVVDKETSVIIRK